MVFGNGGELSRTVTITSRGVVKEAFAPPRPPANLRVGNISAAGIELNWNTAGQGLSYRIYSGTSNNPANASFAGTTAGTSYRVSNLRSATDYYFWVTSQEGPLEGDKGQAVTAKTPPPPPPENVRVGTISAAGIELNWNTAGQGLSYRIYSGTSNNPAGASLTGTAVGTSYRVGNLRSSTNYYFWISSQEGTLEGSKGQMVTAKSAKIYVLGETGPGGGIVFYVNGGRGMEVSGILGTVSWSEALTLARNYKGGGYSDWRLPTKDELNLVYQNLRAKNIGNLGNNWHWSSSENYSTDAWGQDFSDGRQSSSTRVMRVQSVLSGLFSPLTL
jgi:fibronectin type 3 domain-containing protein